MKQSSQQTRLVWTVGIVILAASFIFAKVATSHSNTPLAGGGTPSTHAYKYWGPSQDYAAVPHPWSLTYARSGSDYRMRDMERHRRWENEERKDGLTQALKWARTEGITLAPE